MTFSDIVGHDRPVMILRRALGNDTLAHAYLFSGDAGIGKKMTALALAAAVQCDRPADRNACGVCHACRMMAAQSHPDLHVLEPDGTEIKIAQIRDIQADLSLKPFEGRKKVLIVDGAEAMNPAAANAFLKTLEEPPGDSLIVLVSALPQSLLATIRSRCQEIRFQPLARAALKDVLMAKRGLSAEQASFLAAVAQGRLGSALSMDPPTERAARDEVLALWSSLPSLRADEVLVAAEALAKDREKFDRMLSAGMEWLRDAMVFRATGDARLLVNGDRVDELRAWADRLPTERMLLDLGRLERGRSMLDRRVSAQLVAENLLMDLAG